MAKARTKATTATTKSASTSEEATPPTADQPQQVALKDTHGNPSDSVVLRPAENSLKDASARNAAFEEAWENHRAQTGGDPTTGKSAYFEEWIQTYTP